MPTNIHMLADAPVDLVQARYAREDIGGERYALRYGMSNSVNMEAMASLHKITNSTCANRPSESEVAPSVCETDFASRYNEHRFGDSDGERYSSSSSRYVQGEVERSDVMSRTTRHATLDQSLSADEKAALARHQRKQEQRFRFYSGSSPEAAKQDPALKESRLRDNKH